MRSRQLPEPWLSIYAERKDLIQERLEEFKNVDPDGLFYELAFCILTPQTSQRHAEIVIEKLRLQKFCEDGFDPVDCLREPTNYIRFHNVKSKRLLALREEFEYILPIINSNAPAIIKRDQLLGCVKGIGMKEASHFLRNIGAKDLAILDRHILKHLFQLEVISEIPRNAPTKKRYLEIEQDWLAFAQQIKIPLDELDLLFWSMQTGEIKK